MSAAVPPIPPFPSFRRVKVVMNIQGEDMTLWPQKREKWWQRLLGSPFELRFFARDYLKIECNGRQVTLQPHYLESTFDTFWIDVDGRVRAQALGGFFPFTLGRQKKLLRGLVVTLAAIPAHLKPKDADVKPALVAIHAYLAALREPDAPPPPGGMRAKAAAGEWLWNKKLRNWQPAP